MMREDPTMTADRLDELTAKWRAALVQLEEVEHQVLHGELVAPPAVVSNLSGRMEMLREVLRDVDESD